MQLTPTLNTLQKKVCMKYLQQPALNFTKSYIKLWNEFMQALVNISFHMVISQKTGLYKSKAAEFDFFTNNLFQITVRHN